MRIFLHAKEQEANYVLQKNYSIKIKILGKYLIKDSFPMEVTMHNLTNLKSYMIDS